MSARQQIAASAAARAFRPGRLLVAAVVCAVALTTLTGCSPRQVAMLGVGVDADGSPLAYLKVCSDHIDTLAIVEDDGGRVAEWAAPRRITDSASIRLLDGTPDWRVVTALPDLKPDTGYILAGWSTGKYNSVATVSVHLTREELAELQIGQVRRMSGFDSKGEAQYLVETVDEFFANACDYEGGSLRS